MTRDAPLRITTSDAVPIFRRADAEAALRSALGNQKGEWVWVTIRRKGSAITVLHNVPIDFSDDKPTSVVVKTTGKDTGKQPGKLPSELTIEVPNEFQIAINDPANGRMVYEAKIGIMSDDKAK